MPPLPHTFGEEPEEWPDRFAPGTVVKVVINAEGIRTKVIEDDGETITVTLANNPFGDFAAFGDRSRTGANTSATSLGRAIAWLVGGAIRRG